MVHPAELLRSTTDGIRNMVAPAGNYLNEVDCGLRIIPNTVSKWLKLERFAKLGVFVVVLSFCEFLQEVLLAYFRGTAEIWGEHYGVPKDIVGWFIYTSEVYAGIFALGVAYWGNRTHRACWIGGLTIFLALAAATLAIPEIYKPYNATEIDRAITGFILCNQNNTHTIVGTPRKHFTIDIHVILVQLFQVFVGLASTSYYSLGVTYIDDHITPQHSPGYIGMVFAAKAIGKQVGIYSSWCPFVMTSGNIFISSVWFSMVSLTLLFGVVTILFPKELPQLAIRRSVDSVVNLATGRHNTQQEPITDGFIKTLTRIVKNKFLMLNLMAYTLVQSALINFRLFEHAFNQSKYRSSLDMFATNFNESGLNQFTSHLLEQPIVAIFSVTTGLLLAKTRPKAKHLVTWNITVFLIIFMMFTSTVFWECLDTNDADVKIRHNVTYIKIEDSCINKNACKLIQALAQVNSVIIYGLMASVVMSNTVINIRSVDVRDIPVAIGLQTTFSGLVSYIFVRSIYYFSADGFFCLIEGENGCQYYSANLSIFLSTLTAALIFVAVLISLAILYVLQDIQLYQDKPEPCDSRDIDIVHLTMVDTTEGNAASHVPVAQVEIVSGPDGFTVRDLNVPTAGVDEVDFDSEAHKSLPITDLDKEEPEPEPSTSNTALRLYNVSLEDILDTLGDDFDSDFEDANEKPGTSTAKHDKDFEDDWDSPTPEKLSEEIRRKVPRRLEFPSFADIKQFSFRNRLAPIKEAHEIPEAGDNAGEEDFTSAIEMVVLKKKEDVKETYGDNMLE